MSKTITTLVILIYLMIILGIGAWASKKIKTAEDYVVAGRSLGFWMFTILIIASCTSGMTLLGVAGLGYIGGWPTIWEQIFVPLSCAICILVYGTKLHKVGQEKKYMTIQDYFSHRFYSPRAMRAVSGIAVLITSAIYLVGQYRAISIVLTRLLGITHLQALLIGAGIVMVYVIMGGLYAVAWTTLIQGLILIIGVLCTAPFVILFAGGFTHINKVLGEIDPNYLKLAFPQQHPPYASYAFLTPAFIVSFFFLLAMGLGSAPHIVNNVLTAKKREYYRWAPLAAFAIYVVIMYLIKMVGFAARVMVEEGVLSVSHPDYSFIASVEHIMPSPVWALFGVVILAAVMSTTDRLLLTIGSCVGWDIYKSLINPHASDKKVNMISRVSVAGFAIITVIMAIRPPALLAWLIWMGIGIMLACFVTPLLFGLYWKRATREGGILSMLIGLVSAVIFGAIHQFIAPLPMHFSFYAFVISVITMVVVSMFTKKPEEKIIKETRTGFYIRK
ncbi:MAG TPA: sodium:solute symporter family protein [Candidatus Aerophobetes bacterium]|uniref:Sodium:solute symporter family protein n=1 Tax=Aerophobetes bacterium TaxID=2030807 RepID=A0A7V5HZU8_UNCAE|nr:sodium:solute symporter family protein [Candidatus Aerophobetes bacterium]